MTRHKLRRRSKLGSLYVWHRYVGIVAALLTLLLALTGIALNHTESIKLDEQYVASDMLLDWYGIRTPKNPISFNVDNHWVCQLGEKIYVNDNEVEGKFRHILGVLGFPHMLVIAVEGEILLLTREGDVIERMSSAQGVPSGMQKIGQDNNGDIIILAAHGHYRTDRDLLNWKKETSPMQIRWALASIPTSAHMENIIRVYRGTGLSAERVILDLHSGRLLGEYGIYIMDGAAILLLFLAGSGVWLWVRGILRRKQHRKKHR